MFNMDPYGESIYQNVSSNSLAYLHQNHHNIDIEQQYQQSTHVLINPHFKSKVYVNPNFNNKTVPMPVNNALYSISPNIPVQNSFIKEFKNEMTVVGSNKIHINPNRTQVVCSSFNNKVYVNPSISTNDRSEQKLFNKQSMSEISDTRIGTRKIHINPNFPKIFVNPKVKSVVTSKPSSPVVPSNILFPTTPNNVYSKSYIPNREKVMIKPVVLTRTKLIREPLQTNKVVQSKKKRRSSLHSKYKIIKSDVYKTEPPNTSKTNRFRIDRRRSSEKALCKKRFVFVNKFTTVRDLSKNIMLKKCNENVWCKRSPHKLQRSSMSSVVTRKSKMLKSKYKLIRKPSKSTEEKKVIQKKVRRNSMVKRFKIVRSEKINKNILKPKLMKKCNIPCPYYKKFGKCKGKENGKCPRKHDSDQISLCTKFLQGACVNENCLLSHKVSPEKMPTCKYYLEGLCTKENCPYIHVKLSAKAEICRDFLEGFCKKATECDKRHQYLCPDYEKYGKCNKQRCPYPHGKMVRKYLVNKQKFTKNCSDVVQKADKIKIKTQERTDKIPDQPDRARYYLDRPVESSDLKNSSLDSQNFKSNCDDGNVEFRSRPKLGELPSFIGFNDS